MALVSSHCECTCIYGYLFYKRIVHYNFDYRSESLKSVVSLWSRVTWVLKVNIFDIQFGSSAVTFQIECGTHSGTPLDIYEGTLSENSPLSL